MTRYLCHEQPQLLDFDAKALDSRENGVFLDSSLFTSVRLCVSTCSLPPSLSRVADGNRTRNLWSHSPAL